MIPAYTDFKIFISYFEIPIQKANLFVRACLCSGRAIERQLKTQSVCVPNISCFLLPERVKTWRVEAAFSIKTSRSFVL